MADFRGAEARGPGPRYIYLPNIPLEDVGDLQLHIALHQNGFCGSAIVNLCGDKRQKQNIVRINSKINIIFLPYFAKSWMNIDYVYNLLTFY